MIERICVFSVRCGLERGRAARERSLVSVLALLGAFACSSESLDTTNGPVSEEREGDESVTLEAEISPLEQDELDTSDLVDKVYGSGLGIDESYGAVRLSITQADGSVEGCSGVLLNNHVLLTAAHCITANNSVSAGNVWRTVRLRYESPSATDLDVTKSWFFYSHPDFPDTDFDYAVGASSTSLGLTTTHFATLYRGTVGTDSPLQFAGNGAPNNDPMVLPATGSPHLDHVDWESVNAWQGLCAGDSGSPGYRPSGKTTGGEPYWQSVPVLARSTSTVDPLPPSCNNNGRAVLVNDLDWIEEIVEFWPQNTYTCTNWTNDAGDPVSWCWDAF